MQNKKTLFVKFRGKIDFLIVVTGLLMSTTCIGQLPKAQDIASKMKVGWNMGNTLEAICGETAWGGAVTTQALIDSAKAAGFNAVRLPCAWFCHSDTNTNVIDESWLSRVKEIVNYCINDSLYVIINIHWDGGWLENNVTKAAQVRVNARQDAYWTQIANYFKDYDEHLLFASANEPNVSDTAGMSVLLSYHQTFINAVRATGGNNSSRTLVIQGPSTDIDKTNTLMNKMPVDQIANRLIVEVHYYTPYQFCLMTDDASWGKMFYYWGKGFHSATDVTRNSTWGEESDVEKYFGEMKTKFVDKGIPVIIGEFSAMKRKLSPPSDQALNIASVEYYYKYIVHSATSKGIIPFCWDTNMGLFNRSTGAILDRGEIDVMMEGAIDTSTTSIASINKNIELYPNPFSSTFNLKVKNYNDIVRISILDMLGHPIETFEHPAVKNSLTFGSTLKPNIYIVQVYGVSWTRVFKVNKI
jgi:aryl-phospho-beta-D-glucosidase BglC (GH1 family)